ncbi:MAG: hypothetical protein AB7U83_15040 [Vicinamibacterales bacterium]
MKKILTLVVGGMLAVGCSSDREPAQAAVNGLETAVAEARPEIEAYAADQLTAVDDAVKAVKAKFDDGHYAEALTDVKTASAVLTSAAERAATRKAELSTEWATFAGMPALIGQIKGRVDELGAMRRLPRGIDKAALDGAKSSLESANALWDDATEAHDDGNMAVAVAKASQAKPIVDSLLSTLGLSPATM